MPYTITFTRAFFRQILPHGLPLVLAQQMLLYSCSRSLEEDDSPSNQILPLLTLDTPPYHSSRWMIS